MAEYLVSPQPFRKIYSGLPGERLFKTLLGAKARVKQVRKVTGKQYFISILKQY